MRLLSIAVIAAGSLLAQSDGSIQGPVLGLFFDRQASALRMLDGIPGAARMGAALDTDFSDAAVAGSGQYAVAIERGGTATVVSGAGRRSLPGARMGATHVVASPRGTAAALVFRDPAEIQVFAGLPEAPRLLRSVDPSAAPASVALSDDGEIVLSLTRTVRGEDVVYAHAGSAPLVFYRARRIAAAELFARDARRAGRRTRLRQDRAPRSRGAARRLRPRPRYRRRGGLAGRLALLHRLPLGTRDDSRRPNRHDDLRPVRVLAADARATPGRFRFPPDRRR